MPGRSGLIILLLAIFALSVTTEPDQKEDDTVAMVKASYLYHLASSNEWPAASKKGRFTIGIYGNHSVFLETSARYGSKPVGSQTIEVVELMSAQDPRNMHIMYIDKTKKPEMALIMQHMRGKSTIITTHFEGALAMGAAVNFKEYNNSIRYELNRKAAEDRGISLGTNIIQWAIP
jgi:YfiR/HmsC-like